MNTPTPEQLETLRVKCAEVCGLITDPERPDTVWDIYEKPGRQMPNYTGSYDSIFNEIQKLDIGMHKEFCSHLFDIVNDVNVFGARYILFHALPWQLAEAFVRTKTEAEQ